MRGATSIPFGGVRWPIAVAFAVAVWQTSLQFHSRTATQFSLAVALGWSGALFLWSRERLLLASALEISLCALLMVLSIAEFWIPGYRTTHRLAPLCAGFGVALAMGLHPIRRHLPALAVLMYPLIIPVPEWLRDRLDLSALTAAAAAQVLEAAGVPVIRLGVRLHLAQASVEVASFCSGLNQIATLLALALVAIALFPFSLRQKGWLLASAVISGFTCNAVRIAMLAVLASRGDHDRFRSLHSGPLSQLCTVIGAVAAIASWWPALHPCSNKRSE